MLHGTLGWRRSPFLVLTKVQEERNSEADDDSPHMPAHTDVERGPPHANVHMRAHCWRGVLPRQHAEPPSPRARAGRPEQVVKLLNQRCAPNQTTPRARPSTHCFCMAACCPSSRLLHAHIPLQVRRRRRHERRGSVGGLGAACGGAGAAWAARRRAGGAAEQRSSKLHSTPFPHPHPHPNPDPSPEAAARVAEQRGRARRGVRRRGSSVGGEAARWRSSGAAMQRAHDEKIEGGRVCSSRPVGVCGADGGRHRVAHGPYTPHLGENGVVLR